LSDVHNDLGSIPDRVVDAFEAVFPRSPECRLVGDVLKAELRAEERVLLEVAPECGRVLLSLDATQDMGAEDGFPRFRVALFVVIRVVKAEVARRYFGDEVFQRDVAVVSDLLFVGVGLEYTIDHLAERHIERLRFHEVAGVRAEEPFYFVIFRRRFVARAVETPRWPEALPPRPGRGLSRACCHYSGITRLRI
jgi:hypothetical protein